MIFIDNKLFNTLLLNFAFGAGSHKAVKIYNLLVENSALDLPITKAVDKIEIDEKSRDKLSSVKSKSINKIIDDCKSADIDIIPIYDNRYPDCLKYISVPPVILYVKGNLPDFDNEPVFCIVGPRKITEFGRKAAYSLSRRLSLAGFTIVGGSASGGDYAVHTGAISVSGRSVMVPADGIITQLNSKTRRLCADVLKNGCIISESFPHYVAQKFNFPIRNRLLAGLSLGVAVVEAPEISGTLITANHAIDQGKDVFVVPGNPVDRAYKGSNSLLRDGATPLIDASDIFSRYIAHFPDSIDVDKAYDDMNNQKLKKNSQKKSLSTLSKDAQLVYNSLDKAEFSIDDLSGIDIGAGDLLAVLTELEMEHFIKSIPGGAYKISD